jgi:hypothetical protein
VTEGEGLGHRQWAVDEVRRGCDEGQLDAVAGQRVQGQERFEPGHAAAGDDNAMTRGGDEVTRGWSWARSGATASR